MRKDNQSTDTNQDKLMLELPDKDFKAAVIKMLQQPITNPLETNEKIEILSKKRNHKKEPMKMQNAKTN